MSGSAPTESSPYPPGAVSWMARNPVAANLVMIILIAGGLLVGIQTTQEVFPEYTVDRISVSVPYPGASPEEVEQGILLSIEDEVRGLDGVKEVTSNAFEGNASISIELLTGSERGKALQDVKNAIDRIQSFPEEAERPTVSLVETKRRVVSLIVYGNVDERTLRDLAEKVRDDLLQRPDVTLVELSAARPLEISIEVPQANLRAYNMTLPQIAGEIGQAAIELPAGGVKTDGGEVLLRTQERRDYGREFLDVVLKSNPDGSRVTVGDVATIRDSFEDTDEEATFDGQRAIRVDLYRVGTESPQSISNAAQEYVTWKMAQLPPDVGLALWDDSSVIYEDRINLLVRNASIGLVLVMIMLGLFLDPKLAFWVMLGIPISILGSFLFIPLTGATINMISLFAFIVSLGIVVDDAIVVGENIYEKRERGQDYMTAAIEGARQISGPVVFAVLTNIVAFLPMFFVPGAQGNLYRQIPSITVTVFALSLVESLFVLPAHLAHSKTRENWFWRTLGWPRRHVGEWLKSFIEKIYGPFLHRTLDFRYATTAVGFALLLLAIGAVAGGHIPFRPFPAIEGDVVRVQAELPFGAPIEETRKVRERLVQAARKTVEQNGGDRIVKGIYTQVGSALQGFGPGDGDGGGGGSHLVGVQVSLVSADEREIGSKAFASAWRKNAGEITGLETISFNAETGPNEGAPLDVELSHRDRETLERAAREVAALLGTYASTADIDSGVSLGKAQMSFQIKPEARSLGINATDLARQVRGAFYGAEALRQQRGRNEVKVMVRLPEEERRTYQTVEQLLLRTESGVEVPLKEAVRIDEGRAYTDIRRRDGRRVISATADFDGAPGGEQLILEDLKANQLPEILARYPGLSYSLEGEQKAQGEVLGALLTGFIMAMFVIYALLAIPFRSYIQPAIVMLAIPFGIIGAVIGHVLLGYALSIISMFGIVALAGVVVNDSLVLIVAANEGRHDHGSHTAVFLAAKRRFRPILLTSLTTFFGLAPMIFETSVQAKFLVPMAISLGFGVLFATFLILILVPSVYLIVEDLAGLVKPGGTHPKGANPETLMPEPVPAKSLPAKPVAPVAR